MHKTLTCLALGAFAGIVTLEGTAHADCSYPGVSSDDAVMARIGTSVAAGEHLQYYQNGYYWMLDEYGWGDMPLRADEFDSHFYATFLIRHGIASPPPPLRQNESGAWEYDPEGISFMNTFHRSMDDYWALSWDIRTLAMRHVDPGSGIPVAAPRGGPFGLMEIWGNGTGTGVVDSFPEDPNSSAWWRSIWDLFKDPDALLEYNCLTFDHRRGFVAIAETIIHENWHDTVAPDHTQGGFCIADEPGRCDSYVFEAPTSAHEYNALSRLQNLGVGSFQVGLRFACDLVEAPADWVPVQTQLVANAHFNRAADRSRFTNLPASGGKVPYTCGLPDPILAVPADGKNFCPGTTQLRCNDFVDCGTPRPHHYWNCYDGCCSEDREPT